MEQYQKVIEDFAREKKWRDEIDFLDHILPVQERYDEDQQKAINALRDRIKSCQDILAQIMALTIRKKKKFQKKLESLSDKLGWISIINFFCGACPKSNTKYDGLFLGIGTITGLLALGSAWAQEEGPKPKKYKLINAQIMLLQQHLTIVDKHLDDKAIQKYRDSFKHYAFSEFYDFMKGIDLDKMSKEVDYYFTVLNKLIVYITPPRA